MILPVLPHNEPARIAALQALEILETPPEPTFDRLTALAARIFGVPAALVSLVDEERQWFKSCYGATPFTRVDRDSAFCAHAILNYGVFVVEDAANDPRFFDHPMVINDPGVRFYAGAPLTVAGGLNVGTLCLVDFKPRTFTQEQCELLSELAACVVGALDARESSRRLAAEIVHREEAEKRLQAILDNTTSVIYLKDCEGHYLLVNRSFEEIFGQPRKAIIGRTDFDLHPPELIGHIRDNDLKVQASTHPIEFEETVQQLDGPHTYISVKFPMRNGDGEVYGICGISTDITNRIRTEAELRTSEARKSAVLNASLDGIVTIDHEGFIIEANPAMTRIFGYPLKQMIGQEMAALIIPQEFREAHRRGMRHLLATGEAKILDKRLELPAIRSDGTQFPVEVTITRIAGDGPPMFTGHMRDITARNETEKRLRQAKDEAERANAAKNHFLSRMSHELRTPLNAILGFGQVLQRRVPDEWHREKTDFIVDAGRHLLDLINDVLDLSRIEAGQTAVAREPVELGALLQECRAMVSPEAALRCVRIEAAVMPQRQVFAAADRQRCKQVFVNLLSNAVKYNRDNGRIDIKVESRGEEIVIFIRDTGHGIAPENMSRLFVPFDRIGADEKGVEGTGIGLVLTKNLVELMGGRLDVTSVVGEGTIFSVRLPAAVSSAPSAMEASLASLDTRPEVETPRKEIVLYAEDNHYNLSLMEEIALEHGGIDLVSVTRGSEVLPRALAIHPKLILLDLHLPEMSGDQILRQIRADATLASIPVVMVSADAMSSQIERLLHEGANEYLTKPLEITRTLDLFDHYLYP